MTPAFDARRLLLGQLHIPFQHQERVLCGRNSSTEKAVLTSVGPVNDLAWYERGKSWTRLQLPIFKEKGGKELRPDGVAGSNEDSNEEHEELAQSIQRFLTDLGEIKVPQRVISVHAEEARPSAEDISIDGMESEEREAKWGTVTQSKTVAIAGYILQEAEKTSSPRPAKERVVQTPYRAFSHNVPGLLRSLGSLPATETIEPSESLLIHLRPSPWSSSYPNSFPTIEILINIDPLTKTNQLQIVRAIISHRVSDLALPNQLADLRFQRQTSITLQNAANSPSISAFLAQSHLDIRSQRRLITPPSLTLKIPQWTINSDKKITTSSSSETEEEGEVEMEYLFSSLTHRQTLPLCVNGYRAQYTTVEAGKAGGRRGEFQLVMERVPTKEEDTVGFTEPSSAAAGEDKEQPPLSSESEFKHFFNTALDFVRGLEKWV